MQHAYECFGSEHCHRLFQDFQKSQNLVRDRSLFMEGGGREKIRGAICRNKWLEGGGAIKFFQENDGEGLQLNLKEFA